MYRIMDILAGGVERLVVMTGTPGVTVVKVRVNSELVSLSLQ